MLPNEMKIRKMIVELYDHPLTTARERQVLDSWYSRQDFTISEIRKLSKIHTMIMSLPEGVKRKTPKLNTHKNLSAPRLKRLVELLSDPEFSLEDIDIKIMEEFPDLVKEGWDIGTTAEKLKKYKGVLKKIATAGLWPELNKE